MSLDIDAIRSQFPQLMTKVYGQSLIYFDNAATTLKPTTVINALGDFYSHETANIHRGAHFLGNEGTTRFEQVRMATAKFINANNENEIIFTRGTTESLNLVATCYAREFLNSGDEVLVSEAEHHSNIVPWQLAARDKGFILKVLPVLPSGMWDMSKLDQVLSKKTKLVSLSPISNVTGLSYPIEKVIAQAKALGAVTVVDAAQSIIDAPVDVQKLNCDFLAFSGHKIFAPFGIGVLFGRSILLEQMPPYQGGGSMISRVTFDETSYLSPPHRFEAGTPNVSGVIGLGAALDFANQVGLNAIHERKRTLLKRLQDALNDVGGVTHYGVGENKTAICSFVLDGCHPSDVGQILDQQGIAIRTGHLCAQPLMERWGITGVMRASLSIYNTEDEILHFHRALKKAKEILS